jgi:hypothetical protein
MRLPTCRETSGLQSRARDQRLLPGTRAGLYLHLLACEGCRNFRRQIDFVRAAMKRYVDRGGA